MKPSLLPLLALALPACSPAPSGAPALPPEPEPVLHAPAQLAGDRFALDMFRELAATQGGNIVFSPASLESLLRLLRSCAAGSTRGELNDLSLGKAGVASALQLRSADALFVDEGLALRNPPTGVRRVPLLRQPDRAAQAVNDWCHEQTEGLITSLVSETGLREEQPAMLALNALYLNERWLHPFDEDATRTEGRFLRADGSSTRVPLMQQRADFRYAEGSDWQAVALFYRRDGQPGEPACFIGILPKGDARAFARGMGVEKYNRIRRALAAGEPQEVDVTLPRMDIDGEAVSLRASLMKLGLRRCFSNAADFSKLTGELVRLSDIVQRARIIVTEESTEAAAVTMAPAPWLQAETEPPKPKCIRFDRPFIWAIGDLTTGAAPFFLGLCENP